MRLCNPICFAIGWAIGVIIVAIVLMSGCAPKSKPVPPSHATGTADGLGGAKADATTLGGIFDALTLSLAPPLLPLAHTGTLVTVDLKQRLVEAQTGNEITQANAASLYGDAIHWKEQAKAEKQHGIDMLAAERSHVLTLKYRVGVSVAVWTVILWQVFGGYMKWGATPFGIIGKLVGK